jgi:hypothetical protein
LMAPAGAKDQVKTHPHAVRPFTVPDSIEWSAVVPVRQGQVAAFSPDGRHFIIQTRRGDIARSANVSSILLFDASAAERHVKAARGKRGAPPPKVLAHIDERRDEDRVSALQWLDNSHVGYIARSSDGRMQGFELNIETGEKSQITQSATDVFAFARAAGTTLYSACVPYNAEKPLVQTISSFSDAVSMSQMNSAATCFPMTPFEMFVQTSGSKPRRIMGPMRLPTELRDIAMSPDGSAAIVVAPSVNAPPHWAQYHGPAKLYLSYDAAAVRTDATSLDLFMRTRYMLIDTKRAAVRPLLDAPTAQLADNDTPIRAFWRRDGRSAIISNVFRPIEAGVSAASAPSLGQPVVAEIDVQSGQLRVIAEELIRVDPAVPVTDPINGFEWDGERDELVIGQGPYQRSPVTRTTYRREGDAWLKAAATRSGRLEIDMRESLESPPKLYGSIAGVARPVQLFDPNPQAMGLRLITPSILQWRDKDGRSWNGGLLLPPGYIPGRRYPLVVQTHGFSSSRFLLDGPGTTAFAAQALANAGFVVLQIQDNISALTDDEKEGPAVAEGFYAGIQKLISDGIVDERRIGLVTFSRTGYHALYLVDAHPDLLSALIMSDTLHAGYSVFMFNATEPVMKDRLAKLSRGRPTYDGIGEWFKANPLYRLGKSGAAVRLEAMGQGVGMWEIYSVLKESNRAVDYILYPDGGHVLEKPAERLSSQGGTVDWMRFWLQGYEDPEPSKAEQYRRWRVLRTSTCNRSEVGGKACEWNGNLGQRPGI